MEITEGHKTRTLVTFVVDGPLYEEFENDLKNILHDNETELEYLRVKEFPANDIYHEITWWITRQLNMKEWVDLDDAETEVLCKIVGEDHVIGTAGPIPFDE